MSECFKRYYFKEVPSLGPVVASRHAQARCHEEGITEEKFEDVLYSSSADTPEGHNVIWREKDGIRLVIILRPEPYRGACLVKTAFRIQPQAVAKK